jgi:hypothetical protein
MFLENFQFKIKFQMNFISFLFFNSIFNDYFMK